MAETFVKSFAHLKEMPKADRALSMLQRVASLVKPIMRKHGWILPSLAEFFPDSPNLLGLNVNGGEKILLRLRPAWAPDTFLEEDAVVRTMLHELSHNVHGPHDENFYKFLAGLEDEYDALQRSGYAGEGFFTPGYRLGTGISHNPPLHFARVRALEAAERRRKEETLIKGGGRLGGWSNELEGLTPRELAARAAERRKQDEITCGSGLLALREAGKATKSTGLGDPPVGRQWTCPVCTLTNKDLTLQCDACLAMRPVDASVGWTCTTCGERGMPHQFLACSFCGGSKNRS